MFLNKYVLFRTSRKCKAKVVTKSGKITRNDEHPHPPPDPEQMEQNQTEKQIINDFIPSSRRPREAIAIIQVLIYVCLVLSIKYLSRVHIYGCTTS